MFSDTFLQVWSLLSAEIILVLLAVVVFLVYRLRKMPPQSGKMENVNTSSGSGIVSVLKEMLLQTDKALTDIKSRDTTLNQEQIDALSLRRQIIEAELQCLEKKREDTDEKDYFQWLVETYKAHCQSSSQNVSMKEEVYISQIKNLETFRELYLQSQQAHIKTQESLQELNTLASSESDTAQEDLKNKITILCQEKVDLKQKYDEETAKLNGIIAELESQDKALTEKISNIEEENEFLVVQIQHLLENEVANSKKCLKLLMNLKISCSKRSRSLRDFRQVPHSITPVYL